MTNHQSLGSRIISIILCVMLLFSLLVPNCKIGADASAFGSDHKHTKSLGGAIAYTKEQEEKYFESLCDEEKASLKQKDNLAAKVLNAYRERQILNKSRKSSRGSLVAIPDFYVWPQIYYDYCVPASTATILYNITNLNYSQPLIFRYTQNQPHLMPQFISERQNVHYYSYISKWNMANSGNMCARLYSTIAYSGVPVAMCISVSNNDNWYYTTGEMDHCLVVYGIYDDFSSIMFGDPVWPYVGCPEYYSFGKETVYQVCKSLIF